MIKWTEFSFILKPSPIGGIGVFTTHDLPKNTRIFRGKFQPRKMLIKNVPSVFLKYCIYLNDDECLGPKKFDRMEIGWYLNHSDQPNIVKIAENYLVAIRDIVAEEEIFVDYNYLNEPEHLKENYYKK